MFFVAELECEGYFAILVPFTALGNTEDGKRLFTCSPKWLRISFPAAEMSAPESGSTSMSADPLREEMWTAIVGAGSVTVAFDVRIHGDPLSAEMIALADGGADCVSR